MTASTLRERYREQVRQEVKEAALAQLAQAGPAGVSISAIGKQLGVSGPALYRYFASRDELLTELVIDAYRDLAAALTAADDPGRDPHARLVAIVRAYRAWALAQPHRYRLLYGPPLPGYDAHAQRLVDAAQESMNLLAGVAGQLGGGEDATPAVTGLLASQLTGWARRRDLSVSPATALRAMLIWSRVHGIVSLEIGGNFASIGVDPGQLLEAELAALAP
jgi:AcrR family transcriptional regulator